jgi:hypothetical protein
MEISRKKDPEKPNKTMHANRRPASWIGMCWVYRTLDSLPAPASYGGR